MVCFDEHFRFMYLFLFVKRNLLIKINFLLGILVFVRYDIKLKWLKARKIESERVTLMKSKTIYPLIFELILVGMVPLPFLISNVKKKKNII